MFDYNRQELKLGLTNSLTQGACRGKIFLPSCAINFLPCSTSAVELMLNRVKKGYVTCLYLGAAATGSERDKGKQTQGGSGGFWHVRRYDVLKRVGRDVHGSMGRIAGDFSAVACSVKDDGAGGISLFFQDTDSGQRSCGAERLVIGPAGCTGHAVTDRTGGKRVEIITAGNEGHGVGAINGKGDIILNLEGVYVHVQV